jgi:pimeloyl-ACP methyl ester carboxylesterase
MLYTRRSRLSWLLAAVLVVLLAMALVGCTPPVVEQAVQSKPTLESGFAEVNGTRLYYEIAGSGQPLVLMHGMGGDTRAWDHNFDEFSRHYRTIRYDMRGFGQSASPEEPYTHEDDLKALLDHLGISKAHIVGQSFGGAQALNFVLAYPDRALSFVSLGGAIPGAQDLPEDPPENAEAQAAMVAALQAGDPEGAARAGLGMAMFKMVREDPELADELVRVFADYFVRHGADEDTLSPPTTPPAQRLGEISAPSLYIIGELDMPRMHAYSDLFTAGIPGARKVVIPGCDHAPNMGEPDEFNAVVLSFLAEVES